MIQILELFKEVESSLIYYCICLKCGQARKVKERERESGVSERGLIIDSAVVNTQRKRV